MVAVVAAESGLSGLMYLRYFERRDFSLRSAAVAAATAILVAVVAYLSSMPVVLAGHHCSGRGCSIFVVALFAEMVA